MRNHYKFATIVAGTVFAMSFMSTALAGGGDETEANRATMRAFVDTAYSQKQVRKAYEAYVVPELTQHNPAMADGREAAIKELEGLMKNPAARFDVKRVIVDGDMAAVHFHGSLGHDVSAAVVEIFRLKDGKIVEHWDAFQVVDTKANAKNSHPYF